MKLNPDFLSHSLDGEAVLVPTAQAEFHGPVQGNRTLAVILECLQNDVTEQDIVDALAARYFCVPPPLSRSRRGHSRARGHGGAVSVFCPPPGPCACAGRLSAGQGSCAPAQGERRAARGQTVQKEKVSAHGAERL